MDASPLPRRPAPSVLAVIALGGMIGASGRHAIGEWLPPATGEVPWATLWTNLAGSFLLGFVLVVVATRAPHSRHLRPFAATGVLGAFTTMSTSQVETALLWNDGHVATALAYGAAGLAAGIAVALAGAVAGRRLAGRPT